jgi:hydroxymethylpyrimidine pyrophosphatase-like HAD family hydrolase
MNNIKMIAVDMDGTFLNRQMEYDRKRFWKLFEIMKNEKYQIRRCFRQSILSVNQFF